MVNPVAVRKAVERRAEAKFQKRADAAMKAAATVLREGERPVEQQQQFPNRATPWNTDQDKTLLELGPRKASEQLGRTPHSCSERHRLLSKGWKPDYERQQLVDPILASRTAAQQQQSEDEPAQMIPVSVPRFEGRLMAEMVTLAPGQFRYIQHTFRYEEQRRLRPGRVEELQYIADTGSWNPESPGLMILLVENEGLRPYLVDGQHRVEFGGQQREPTMINVTWQKVPDKKDVDRIYQDIDAHTPRSVADVLRTTDLVETSGLPETFIPKLVSATKLIGVNFRAFHLSKGIPTRSRQYSLKACRDWLNEAKEFHSAIEGSGRSMRDIMVTMPVLAVSLVLFRYQSDKAEPFLRRVALNDALKQPEPAWRLHNFLTSSDRKHRSAQWIARYMAACWSAEFEDRSCSQVRFDENKPIRLAGTPWKGK